MKGYSAEQLRAAEAPHLAAGEPLMARAAAALARECGRMLEGEGLSLRHSRAVVLVGGGNNGGDALFAAAALAARGVTVELVCTAARVHEEGFAAARAAGAVELTGTPKRLAVRAASADLVVDGILGTGTSPDPRLRGVAREIVAELVALIAARRARNGRDNPGDRNDHDGRGGQSDHGTRALEAGGTQVVAVDLPSGIHPDTGEIPDPAAVLHADVTVTFGGAKAGLLLPPGSGCAGDIRLVDIGLAAELESLTPLVET